MFSASWGTPGHRLPQGGTQIFPTVRVLHVQTIRQSPNMHQRWVHTNWGYSTSRGGGGGHSELCITILSTLSFIEQFTFTFMHLADAFIQSDLQLHSGYTFSLVHVFPGNRTHNLSLSWRNVLPLSHTGTGFEKWTVLKITFFFPCVKNMF